MRGGILIKRVFDGIIGLAVGDALGVPVEFKTRAEIKNNPVIGMRGYGTHNQPIGTWSDDTSLTLALIDSLIKKEDLKQVVLPEFIMEHRQYQENGLML